MDWEVPFGKRWINQNIMVLLKVIFNGRKMLYEVDAIDDKLNAKT
jgi:hypothetical protein